MVLSPWQAVDDLFDELLDMEPAQQQARLNEVEPDIAAHARRLLALDQESGLLSGAAMAHLDVDDVFDDSAEATRLGPWRIEEKLGRGGMGTVFRASRADGTYQQEVAIKLLRRGLDTDDILRRFENERQILARLEHPAITRLIDGGSAEDGRPWLVMELVDGQTLLDYCQDHQPALQQRLGLFAEVCDAVQYAHQRLIVHRDLKPANILVTANGAPRLLDFGIAKLLDKEQDATRTGHHVLTPRWAAPEQLTGEPVTTATDVYALGLVLYQLLTGQHPFPDARGDKKRRTGPVRPSRAATDQNNPPVRPQRLRGDLDAVVQKALQRDPALRYESAGALAADIRRFLAGESVSAHPETLLQGSWRFLRQHWIASAVGLLFLVLVAAWTATATLQAERLEEERDRARMEAARAEQTATFIEGMLEAADPRQAAGDELTAKEALQASARAVETELRNQPELQGRMRIAVGRAHIAIRDYKTAAELLEQAAEQLTQELGQEHPSVAIALYHLAVAERGLGQFDAAVKTASEALRIQRHTLFPLDEATADTLVFLADTKADPQGQPAAARPMIAKALTIRLLGGHPPEKVARTMAIAGFVELLLRNNERAIPLLERALKRTVAIRGDHHPDVADILQALSFVSDPDEAIGHLRRVIEIQRKAFGPASSEVLASLNNLALRLEKSDPKESIATLKKAVALADRNKWNPTMSIRLRINLGAMLRDDGQYQEGRQWLAEARDIAEKREQHRLFAWVVHHQARLEHRAGDADLAIQIQREALRLSLEHAPRHNMVPRIHLGLAETLRERDELDAATSEARAALEFPHDQRYHKDAWLELGEISIASERAFPDDVKSALQEISKGSGNPAKRANELLKRNPSYTVD